MPNNIYFTIVGPTASGKTSLAIELAKKINGEIIGLDSRQIYKGMKIGTAQPSRKERDGVGDFAKEILKERRAPAQNKKNR